MLVRHVAACAGLLALAGACAAADAPFVAEAGVPFTLHVGQSARLGASLRVTLTALQPQGECPGQRPECVAVAPPQAQLDFSEGAAASAHSVLPLLGKRSAEQHAGHWRVRVVDVAPFPFTLADAASGQASITLLVSAAVP
jgi:hypothetical protein